jgi:ubiquitin-protein ligase/DNA-directed RNA polymerase subunit RPC12/RpoP
MIEFSCTSCGRAFAVPDHFAGRRAKCKSCGVELTVPQPKPAGRPRRAAAQNPEPESAPKIPMRIRRLAADAEQMGKSFADCEWIKIQPLMGDPPDIYRIDYAIASLERDAKGKPISRAQHAVEIQLTTDYPRLSPSCKMLTPIFHPNIDPATICVGDHWTAGERLVDLVVRIGEMLAYQAYNIRSPLDAEAAMWADLNPDKLPTDSRVIRPPGME